MVRIHPRRRYSSVIRIVATERSLITHVRLILFDFCSPAPSSSFSLGTACHVPECNYVCVVNKNDWNDRSGTLYMYVRVGGSGGGGKTDESAPSISSLFEAKSDDAATNTGGNDDEENENCLNLRCYRPRRNDEKQEQEEEQEEHQEQHAQEGETKETKKGEGHRSRTSELFVEMNGDATATNFYRNNTVVRVKKKRLFRSMAVPPPQPLATMVAAVGWSMEGRTLPSSMTTVSVSVLPKNLSNSKYTQTDGVMFTVLVFLFKQSVLVSNRIGRWCGRVC